MQDWPTQKILIFEIFFRCLLFAGFDVQVPVVDFNSILFLQQVELGFLFKNWEATCELLHSDQCLGNLAKTYFDARPRPCWVEEVLGEAAREDLEGENMLQRATTVWDDNETESTEVDFGINLYPECFIYHEKTLQYGVKSKILIGGSKSDFLISSGEHERVNCPVAANW